MNKRKQLPSYNTSISIDSDVDIDLFSILRDNIDDDEVREYMIKLIGETDSGDFNYSDMAWAYHQGNFDLVALINAIGKECVIAEMEKPTCR